MKINPRKVKLFKPTVVFLGMLLQRGAIHLPVERVKSFIEWGEPRTRCELRKFVNSLGFFRSSIPHYAEKTVELLDLITQTDPAKKNRKKFVFTEGHRRLFDQLKEAAKNYLPLY